MSSRLLFGDHLLTLAQRLYEGHAVTRRYIEEHLDVSKATATWYMVRLECALPVAVDVGEQGTITLRIMKTPTCG